MFTVLLRFSENKCRAGEFMEDHNQWIKQGFEDGLLAGSLQPNQGKAVVAHNVSLPELQDGVSQDPFVQKDIVSAKIL